MDYEQVIAQHMGLPHKLGEYAKRPDGTLKADDIQADDSCGLGQWLQKDGSKHRDLAEYAALTEAHTRLHGTAADIIKHADAGTMPAEALADKGEFQVSFATFLMALMKLRTKIR
jgi:hypothetical protein